MAMRKLLTLGCIGLAAAMLAGCPPPPATDTTAPPGRTGEGGAGVLKIGHFASLTGNTAMFGQTTERGVQLAVEEVNAGEGPKIEVQTLDDASQQQQAPIVVGRLINEFGATAIVGEVASSRTIAAAPVAEAARVPLVTPSSTNPDVTVDPRTGKTRPHVFRVCFTDTFQGAVIARFVKEHLNLSNAALLIDSKNAYSVGLGKGFSDRFKQLGGSIVAEESYSEGDQDFRAQLTRLRSLNPGALVVPGYYREVGLIVQQARQLGLNVPVVGGDGWDSETLTNVGPQFFHDCYFINHFSPEEDRPEVKAFVAAYQKKYNEQPNALAALGYDAVKLVADAARRAGSVDRAALRDALEQTQDFVGVTGKVAIDAQHNPVKSAVIVRVSTEGGKTTFPLVTTIAPE